MELQIIEYNQKYYYWNEPKQMIQNVEDPSDFILFQDLDFRKIEGLS